MARPRSIFLIWIDECKNDITWVVFFPRVNGITVILFIATFIRSAVSACPVVILCQCPGVSQCWLASCERNLLLQAWPSFNCLYFLPLSLLFKCCPSSWWFKYLFSSGRRRFLSFVTSSHISVLIWFIFYLFFCYIFLLNSSTSFIKILCH